MQGAAVAFSCMLGGVAKGMLLQGACLCWAHCPQGCVLAQSKCDVEAFGMPLHFLELPAHCQGMIRQMNRWNEQSCMQCPSSHQHALAYWCRHRAKKTEGNTHQGPNGGHGISQ